MSERESILARIREALKVPAPKPGGDHQVHVRTGADLTARPAIRQWLPAVGESFENRLELFRKNATDLKADLQIVESREQLIERLAAIQSAENWNAIASHAGQLTEDVCDKLKLPVVRTDRPYVAAELEKCGAGITQCDALVAQTGSVLITSRSAGGRALSVLPPHHVVLAQRHQLLPDLPSAFELLKQNYAPNYPSFISLITGPSRTGDIERILVLGAHGPKKLTIFLL